MGQQYLIDSNAAIDYLGNKLPTNGTAFIDALVPVISVITRIEMLGWFEASQEQINKLLPFIDNAFIYPLSEPVILQTILIRQKHKIKTPDSIIAATALVHNHFS
ncbi:MAG: twitching motility protein PilT [Segetibacter sp.]|nr:twitching motility protein PilT [Segetibacter sp.]